MDKSWDQQVEDYWNASAAKSGEQLRAELDELLSGLDPNDPRVLFEIASLHDFRGEEQLAVEPYSKALQAGLPGQKQDEARIQLASTLRNLGDFDQAISLLEQVSPDSDLHIDAQGFLTLALSDAGRQTEAVRIAVTALAPASKLNARALSAYAHDLSAPGVAQS